MPTLQDIINLRKKQQEGATGWNEALQNTDIQPVVEPAQTMEQFQAPAEPVAGAKAKIDMYDWKIEEGENASDKFKKFTDNYFDKFRIEDEAFETLRDATDMTAFEEMKKNERQAQELDELAIKTTGKPAREEDIAIVAIKGLYQGVLSLGETGGLLTSMTGAALNNTALSRYGKAVADVYSEAISKASPKDKTLQDFSLKSLARPSWYVYNIAKTIPTMLPVIGTGELTAATTTKLLPAIVKNMTPTKIAKLAKLAGSILGGLSGGSLEGAGTYKTVLDLGGSEDQALKSGLIMTGASSMLNAISMFSFLEARTSSNIAKVWIASLKEGITEYLEEPTEAGILYSQGLIDKQQSIEQIVKGAGVIPISMATTFLTGGFGAIQNYQAQNKAEQKIKNEFIDYIVNNTISAFDGEKITPIGTNPEQYNPNSDIVLNKETKKEQAEMPEDIVTLKSTPAESASQIDVEAYRKQITDKVNKAWDNSGVKAMGIMDMFAYQYSGSFTDAQKAKIERNARESLNLVYSMNRMSEEYYNTYRDLIKKDEYKDFTLWAENPTKHPAANEDQLARWTKARDLTFQFDGENKQKIDAVIEDNIKTIQKKYGVVLNTDEIASVKQKHMIGVSFPSKFTISALEAKLGQIDNTITRLQESGEDVSFAQNERNFYQENLDIVKKDMKDMQYFPNPIRASEKYEALKGKKNLKEGNFRVLNSEGIQVYKSISKQASLDFINKNKQSLGELTLESTINTGTKVKTEKTTLSDIESKDRGRLTTWEKFYDLPEDVREKYYSNPVDIAMQHMMMTGYRYSIVKFLNTMLNTEGVFISGKEENDNYSSVPKELTNVYPELSGLKVNNLLKNMITQITMTNQSFPERFGEILGGASMLNNVLVNWVIANPIVMAVKNVQQTAMVSPMAYGFISKTMSKMGSETYKKDLQFAIDIGMVTGDIYQGQNVHFDIEGQIDYLNAINDKETPAMKRVALRLLDPKTAQRNNVVKGLVAVSNASRKVAFDIGDTTFKVGIANWIRGKAGKAVADSKKYGKMVYPDDSVEFIKTKDDLSNDEILIRKWSKAYNEKYKISELIGNYGRIMQDSKTVINLFETFWQLRASQISATTTYAKLAFVDKDKEAVKRLGYWFVAWWLDKFVAGALGYIGGEQVYRLVKKLTRDDESAYIFTKMKNLFAQQGLTELPAEIEWYKMLEPTMIEKIMPQYLGNQLTKKIFFPNDKSIMSPEDKAWANYDVRINDDGTVTSGYGIKEDAMMGQRRVIVSSHPLSMFEKIAGKGIKGIFPSESPLSYIAQNILSDEPVGTYIDGAYKVLSDYNSNPEERVKALAIKYWQERVGISQIYNSIKQITSDDPTMPKYAPLFSLLGNIYFVYNKTGKEYSQIVRAAQSIMEQPYAQEALILDINGEKRSPIEKKYVESILLGYTLADSKDGIGDKKYLNAIKDYLRENNAFGGGVNFAREWNRINNSFRKSSVSRDNLYSKNIISAFIMSRDSGNRKKFDEVYMRWYKKYENVIRSYNPSYSEIDVQREADKKWNEFMRKYPPSK